MAQHTEKRPRWAGANGFDYAWTLNESYVQAAELVRLGASAGLSASVEGSVAILEHKIDTLQRQMGTYEGALKRAGHVVPSKGPIEPMFPGTGLTNDGPDTDELLYATGLGILAAEHRQMLLQSTPILFDPLSTPELDEHVVEGLRLPFPVVTCDFLAQSGLSMPVTVADGTTHWVGLIAATLSQSDEAIDVWPVVTTLHADRSDAAQHQRALFYGRIRLNGTLPPAPDGLVLVERPTASAWVMPGNDDEQTWASLWCWKPALAAASALRLLEAVNVSLEEASLPRAERRRAARVGAEPSLEVVIRSSGTERTENAAGHSIDWQHRWTVRGHWMHFKRGRVFEANPRKRVTDPVHGECVRVWCPPFVKGPKDKPLVLKSRRLNN